MLRATSSSILTVCYIQYVWTSNAITKLKYSSQNSRICRNFFKRNFLYLPLKAEEAREDEEESSTNGNRIQHAVEASLVSI